MDHHRHCPAGRVRRGVPDNLLEPTGRLSNVLAAWARGGPAEVPAGIGFDVLRMPAGLARPALARMRAYGTRTGPVVFGPSGAEFLVRVHSAGGWREPDAALLPRGELVLLPPPEAGPDRPVGERAWLVRPVHHCAGMASGWGVAWGGELSEPYREAHAARAETAADPAS
ncbi:hypothetical protein CUT44_31155 [Streptomyces carminius]|uniref:DNA primase/polymerase bifunctional N-terminal domain-containing protein n=1 Tax=Streptomyces carminius TaxID=2665496 RepID=A0A2M8LP03_9ACTN|nr:hypothetical protein [Streptomyces carminius]PJE93689.1 hypothetical protein CUT44_31155 [Streptomyces carminius]